jgi:hypothetical protein
MRIEFTVNNLPPKKDGANSMWRKETEVPRIISLREKALETIKEHNYKIQEQYLRLEFTLFVPEEKIESIGDLDNFITGICDGLQAAHYSVTPHSLFNEPGREEIHPRKPILIINDSKVLNINASKSIIREGTQCYYNLLIEPVLL